MESSTNQNEQRIFNVTENGTLMDGTGRVSIPACRVKATSYMEAVDKLSTFLKTRELSADIELITPLSKIHFE